MKSTPLLLITVCTGLMLCAGCVVGPDFERPGLPFDMSAFASAQDELSLDQIEATAVQASIRDIHSWWVELGDPLLAELLMQAVQDNPGLQQASSRVLESRSIRESILGTAWPQISTDVGFAHRRLAPGSSGQEGRRSGDPFDAYTHNLRATWEIDLFGRIQRSVESANAQAHATQENYRGVLVSLLADVATNYVELRVLQHRLSIARENLGVQNKNMKMAKTRHKAGLVGLLDVKQAETSVRTTEAQVPSLEEQIRVRLHRLSTLMGQPPSHQFFARVAEGPVPSPQVGISSGIPAQLVRQRPDVRAAEYELHSAVAEIGVATAELYPQISLLGSPSFDTSLFSKWYRSQSFGFSVGPTVSWNVFAFGRIQNTIDARQNAADQAELQFREAVLLAIEEVENGLVSWRKSQERARALEQAAEAAAEAVGLSESTYQIGNSTFQRVVDAQRQLLSAQDSLASAKGDVVLNWIRTYRALGGGWRNAPQMTIESAPQQVQLLHGDSGFGSMSGAGPVYSSSVAVGPDSYGVPYSSSGMQGGSFLPEDVRADETGVGVGSPSQHGIAPRTLPPEIGGPSRPYSSGTVNGAPPLPPDPGYAYDGLEGDVSKDGAPWSGSDAELPSLNFHESKSLPAPSSQPNAPWNDPSKAQQVPPAIMAVPAQQIPAPSTLEPSPWGQSAPVTPFTPPRAQSSPQIWPSPQGQQSVPSISVLPPTRQVAPSPFPPAGRGGSMGRPSSVLPEEMQRSPNSSDVKSWSRLYEQSPAHSPMYPAPGGRAPSILERKSPSPPTPDGWSRLPDVPVPTSPPPPSVSKLPGE